MHKYVSIKWNVFWQVCQCFVFCALLEFALVNYASRSDMQRDRARERNERARRQWELEHADMQQLPPGSGPPTSGGGIPTSGSQTPGNNVTSMNHLGSSDALDGIPGFSLVSRPATIVHSKFFFFFEIGGRIDTKVEVHFFLQSWMMARITLVNEVQTAKTISWSLLSEWSSLQTVTYLGREIVAWVQRGAAAPLSPRISIKD